MLPEQLNNPQALTILTLVIALVLQYQRSLSWTEYQTLHALKRAILPTIDKVTKLFVVSRKGGRDDAEYVSTVNKSVRETYVELDTDGFDPHLINSLKQRPHPDFDGPQYNSAALVKVHRDGTQTEIYLFDMGGETDVYAHVERAVTDPKGHLLDTNQRDGDVKNVLPKWVS